MYKSINMALINLIEKYTILWSSNYEKEVINTLQNWKIGVKRSRSDYRIHEKYALKKLTGAIVVIK